MARQLRLMTVEPQQPTLAEEVGLVEQGYRSIAGIDEVGRGPLAGPLIAAAVILPAGLDAPWLSLVRDSKQLTPRKREYLFHYISETAVGIGVGSAPHKVIDHLGIAKATGLAMELAVANLNRSPDFLLIDFVKLPGVPIPQRSLPKGDTRSISIACASIIAKVTRDRFMVELDKVHPGYGFASHKGYATREHLESLERLGACPIHRKRFAPVRDALARR
jgi:ribonuclease HII